MDAMTENLVDQLDFHWTHIAGPRLAGLTDAEYLWEPVVGTWSVRHRDEQAPASATRRAGSGDWLLDVAAPAPEPAPLTSIAWRLGHVIAGVLGPRAHAHFEGPATDPWVWPYAGTAEEALVQLTAAYEAWTAGVRALTPESLMAPVGPAEGSWSESPMLTLVLHINRETIHHLAEVALLRDLWLHQHR